MSATQVEKLAEAVSRLCPEVGSRGVAEFLARMDERYSADHTPLEVALHVRMALSLGPSRRGAVSVDEGEEGRFRVTVVAYDYFAEFSLLCGLLSSRGLAIEAGCVHTFAPLHPLQPLVRPRSGSKARPTPSRKTVDVFRVIPQDPAAPPEATILEGELEPLPALLSEGKTDEARESMNRRLVGSLARSGVPFAGTVSPVEISFENDPKTPWTAMRVRGRDTPAFLYSIANA